jgi:hypothetical protein
MAQRGRLRAVLAGTILTSITLASGGRPALAAACPWTVVPTPQNNFTSIMGFLAVAASSPTDAWAVGYDRTASVRPGLIEHWDGVRWTVMRNPDPHYSFLYDVVAISSDDVWAVGSVSQVADTSEALILHWDGSSWSKVPAAPGGVGSVHSVDGAAPNDVWAVGAAGQHWDGSTWSSDPGADFSDVDVISATDAWAVGSRYQSGRGDHSVFGHWDGSSWTVTRPFKLDGPSALAAVSSDDVWAVGQAKSGFGVKTLAEHWDGSSWSLVDAPTAGRQAGYQSLAAKASDDLWAVGSMNQIAIGMHWDGTAWAVERLPHSPDREVLYGVTSVPGGGWLAAGWQGNYPVIMQHC